MCMKLTEKVIKIRELFKKEREEGFFFVGWKYTNYLEHDIIINELKHFLIQFCLKAE